MFGNPSLLNTWEVEGRVVSPGLSDSLWYLFSVHFEGTEYKP